MNTSIKVVKDNKEIEKCPRCGSNHLQKYGFSYSNPKGVKRQNFLCQKCRLKVRGRKLYPTEPEPFIYKEQGVAPQNWSAYSKAQNNEKRMLMNILDELLSQFKIIVSDGKKGRKYSDLKNMTFCLALKTYTKLSSRRLNSDLEKAQKEEFIDKVPHFTTLMGWLEKEELTDLLQQMIKLSALPVKNIESDYAIDSSGFSSSQFGRWFNYKYEEERICRNWVKAHIMCGTKTNIITSVELTKAHGADSPQLQPLLEKTCKDFDVKAVSADKAYSSKKNLQIIHSNGAIPYIPFKSNVTGKKRGSQIWSKMFDYFQKNPQQFFEKYHKRSNVETCFSMIKQKFGKDVMSKNFQSQTNEVLLKILCHNICCLIQEFYEKNIESFYSTDQPKSQTEIRIG